MLLTIMQPTLHKTEIFNFRNFNVLALYLHLKFEGQCKDCLYQ
jgi:hypothetical protein